MEEDEAAAFQLFEAAAERQHPPAMFMVADCLLENAGCGANADKTRISDTHSRG